MRSCFGQAFVDSKRAMRLAVSLSFIVHNNLVESAEPDVPILRVDRRFGVNVCEYGGLDADSHLDTSQWQHNGIEMPTIPLNIALRGLKSTHCFKANVQWTT